MHFDAVKVSLMAPSIPFKILSAHCVTGKFIEKEEIKKCPSLTSSQPTLDKQSLELKKLG